MATSLKAFSWCHEYRALEACQRAKHALSGVVGTTDDGSAKTCSSTETASVYQAVSRIR